MLGRKWAVPALWLPKVKGCTRDIVYLLLTLGRKMGLRAVWFPKVQLGGWITMVRL